MVYRGKPSRACQRCRTRRLKCDLQRLGCAPCLRANVACSGYRADTVLRIIKFIPSVPRLPLSLDVQARDAFFTFLVPSISQYWEFLKQLYSVAEYPKYLTLAIEAVSLGYLWHRVYSSTAQTTAQERYITALRALRKTIQVSGEALRDTKILLAALMLDLYEKISGLNHDAWMCHVDGGLALVQLDHLKQVEDPFSIRILVRLITNHTISSVVRGSQVDDRIFPIRAFLASHVDCWTPHWQLQDFLVRYAKIRNRIKERALADDEIINASLVLDTELEKVERNMPISWRYSTKLLQKNPAWPLDLQMDVYPNRGVCQNYNGLRLLRILLNESILQTQDPSESKPESNSELTERAHKNIKRLTNEICASTPQYLRCECDLKGFPHTPDALLDCYTIIFPLFVVGRSLVSPEMKERVFTNLYHLERHFHIRNAKLAADVLERETIIDCWDVYAQTGSYAFAA